MEKVENHRIISDVSMETLMKQLAYNLYKVDVIIKDIDGLTSNYCDETWEKDFNKTRKAEFSSALAHHKELLEQVTQDIHNICVERVKRSSSLING